VEKRRRTGYPSDVSDEEWAFVAPYLTLCKEEAEQRDYPLRTVFNAVRYVVRSGIAWRMMPNDLPPWNVVYQQMRRWMDAGCFEMIVEDLRMLLREFAGRAAQPTAVILDSRTLQSTPESGARAGYDGAKRRKGSKVHAAVDTLGHLLALHVTPADEQDRAQVSELARQVQEVTGEHVELAFVDQGYTGENAAMAAAEHGIELEVVKHTQAKRGFVLLPRRGRAQLCLGRTFPPPGARLRASGKNPGRFSFPGLRLSHARQPLPLARRKLITGSKNLLK
jgi:transposase